MFPDMLRFLLRREKYLLTTQYDYVNIFNSDLSRSCVRSALISIHLRLWSFLRKRLTLFIESLSVEKGTLTDSGTTGEIWRHGGPLPHSKIERSQKQRMRKNDTDSVLKQQTAYKLSPCQCQTEQFVLFIEEEQFSALQKLLQHPG